MVLSSYDVLETSGVIIIGLTLLLTFQSVSSTFIENDMNEFFTNLSTAYIANETNNLILLDCYIFERDQSFLINEIKESKIDYSESNLNAEPPLGTIAVFEDFTDETFDSFSENFSEKCAEAILDQKVLDKQIIALQNWGKQQGYLGDDYDPNDYFSNVASGPLIVVLVNLVMIMPFALAAIVELSLTHKNGIKQEDASRLSVKFLLGGFVILVIGFILIGYFFWEANIIIWKQWT